MFDIPGFEPRTMTDDELLRRQQELQSKITFAHRFGMQPESISQMQSMLLSIEHVRRERMMQTMFDMRNAAFPDVIETEPGLKPEEAPVEQKPRPAPVQRSRRPIATPVPTTTPQETPR